MLGEKSLVCSVRPCGLSCNHPITESDFSEGVNGDVMQTRTADISKGPISHLIAGTLGPIKTKTSLSTSLICRMSPEPPWIIFSPQGCSLFVPFAFCPTHRDTLSLREWQEETGQWRKRSFFRELQMFRSCRLLSLCCFFFSMSPPWWEP